MSKKKRTKNKTEGNDKKLKMVEMLNLPKDVTLNMPVVNLEGKTGVYIENYKGIIEYFDDTIVINTTVGLLQVVGSDLSIKSITSEDIMIKGRLRSVSFKN